VPVPVWISLAGEGVLFAATICWLLGLDVSLPAAGGIGALSRVVGLWAIQQLDPLVTLHSPEDVVTSAILIVVLLGTVQLVRGS
jgi:hypothetical protein